MRGDVVSHVRYLWKDLIGERDLRHASLIKERCR